MVAAMERCDVQGRIDEVDWLAAEADLGRDGFARLPGLVSADACRRLAKLYPDDRHFRARIDMERYRYGIGDYSYFAAPLPDLVTALRAGLFPHLAPIANRMNESMGREPRYPGTLEDYLGACHEAGQSRPTPLLLRYSAGGYNCLHRDLYGALVFPLQVMVMLSRRGRDYEGGQFLLVENLPRRQARGEAIEVAQGEAVIFPVHERPVPGKRGMLRASLRHGVSRITEGERMTLGVIFHDAE